MVNIYLIRHGETDCNVKGIWQGNLDVPLNDKGIFQAETLSEGLASKLKDKQIKTIYSSPLVRAVETAETIARMLNAKVTFHNDLRDTELGDWEGQKSDIVASSHLFSEWALGETCAPNGESKRQVYNRAVRAFTSMANTESKDFVVVTHNLVIHVMICFILNTHMIEWGNFAIDNGAVTTLSFNKETQKFKIITLNELL